MFQLKLKSSGGCFVKSNNISKIHLESVNLLFVERNKIDSTMSDFLPKHLQMDVWLEDMFQYQEKCLMNIDQQNETQLNETLKLIYLSNTSPTAEQSESLAEIEIIKWKSILGRQIKSTHNLYHLINNPTVWKTNKLETNIKIQMENTLKQETMIDSSSGSYLYLGLYYVQVRGTGLQVMLQSSGPYNMIPIVQFSANSTLSAQQSSWLKLIHEHEIGKNMNLTIRSNQIYLEELISDSTPELVQFQHEFWNGINNLSTLIGTSRDLIGLNFNTNLISISSDVHFLPFVVCNMSVEFPADYSSSLFFFKFNII
jgi:hypothetical protein